MRLVEGAIIGLPLGASGQIRLPAVSLVARPWVTVVAIRESEAMDGRPRAAPPRLPFLDITLVPYYLHP